jgi:type II secretory pathway predicted ATPase ExeA
VPDTPDRRAASDRGSIARVVPGAQDLSNSSRTAGGDRVERSTDADPAAPVRSDKPPRGTTPASVGQSVVLRHDEPDPAGARRPSRRRRIRRSPSPDTKSTQPVTPWEQFHGLSARPFSLTPDLRFVYHSRSHSRALDQVTSALGRREGLIVITGEIGSGKTMLCRTLLETFDDERTFLSVILDPGLSVSDLLYRVLIDFGLVSPGDPRQREPLTDVTRHQLVTTLQQFLASLIPLGAHAVIMIDEAQHLSPSVLEEIRLLSNFETDQAKLLQIVLVGQPNLDDVLRQPDMRQLNQRIARRFELQPLSESEVADYIDRRLFVAAGSDSSAAGSTRQTAEPPQAPLVQFTPAATAAVAAISRGIPRIVNTLCDRALEIAFERETHAIDPVIVRTAAQRLKLPVPAFVGRSRSAARVAAAAALLIATAALGLYWWSGRPAAAPTEPAAPPGAAAKPAPETAAPAGASTDRAAPTQESSPPLPQASPLPPAPATGTASFEIAVAAFRTERRAAEVSAAIGALGLPVSTRSTAGGVWYQVAVGPFATAEEAEKARAALVREGYADARVSTR